MDALAGPHAYAMQPGSCIAKRPAYPNSVRPAREKVLAAPIQDHADKTAAQLRGKTSGLDRNPAPGRTFSQFLAQAPQSTPDLRHSSTIDRPMARSALPLPNLRHDMIAFFVSKGMGEDHACYLCDQWKID